ncbi:CPW-WPC family protein [Plasmodium reichenowi]|uniref:CPW-WPC family protein n=1 Tax=Plasmodium reichenowi TaxID=5854 RepID=A0A2P9D993_PLARE|nr:CPW-WPC family protein [Plasmodium reichenowi]
MDKFFFFFFFFFFCFYFEISFCENDKKEELFSDNELGNIGGSAGDIISSSSRAPSSKGSDNVPPNVDIAGDLLKVMKHIPPPVVELNEDEFIDPEIVCERDYDKPCPNDYNYLGSVHTDDDEICAPSSTYEGPCSGEELNIKNMSEKRKEKWSIKCETFWPCKRCVRNYTSFCPEKWYHVNGTLRSCKPLDDYTGPCIFEMNFSGYNKRMLEDWSLKCKAWWKCDHIMLSYECPDMDVPITEAATRWRLKKNYH